MTTEQSTFMIDLHQVGMMLRYLSDFPFHVSSNYCSKFLHSLYWRSHRQATPRSLCLLD